MRILLIWPPTTVYAPDPLIPSSTVPLGLAYIAAVLEKNNYEVRILDALLLGIENVEQGEGWVRTGLGDDEITRRVEEFKPDIVGISSMFTGYAQDVHNCVGIVKQVDPTILVIVGGAHASANPDLVLEDRNIDLVLKGEGEITFLKIVKKLEKGDDIFTVPGTIVRKQDGNVLQNPERGYIQDLDSIPFPARHLLPMDTYLKYYKAYYERYGMRHPHLGIVTSRGCPARCVFCSIHSVWGHTWRGRSAKNVVDEIELLVKEYGIREMSISDDNLGVDKKRAIEICEELKARKIDIKWCTPNGIAIWTLDKELIKKMKGSGCYRITLGIESGNQKTQKFIGKVIKFDQARELIKYANSIGLWTICTFIIGFPYETEDSIKDTIKYAINCDTDFALFYILGPFPGTPVYEIFKKEGLLNGPQNWGYILGGGGCDTKFFTKEELKSWQAKANSDFFKHRLLSFLNPLRIATKIHSFENLLYAARMVIRALKMKQRQLGHREGDVKMWVGEIYRKAQRAK